MTISIICAMGMNREIGKENKLLWNIKGDMRYFRELTTNKIVVMGRNTYESILSILGEPLPSRTNIVITSNDNYKVPYDNVYIIYSIDRFLYDYKAYADKKEEIFIIGGEQVYKQFLPYADKLYLTIVHSEFPDADSFFPAISDKWKVVSKQDNKANENNEYDYSFLVYEKKNKVNN